MCPYLYAKYVSNKVNVLLCPYNYILSPTIRKMSGINISESIIVFDEGHNV